MMKKFRGLRRSCGNGNFWLAASVAFTNFAIVLDKPYSIIFYGMTMIAALVGAFLKSTTDDGARHVDH